MSLQEDSREDSLDKLVSARKRQDIYDDQIDKFMSNKYARDAII